jgi:Relaxase/Mobilisation nuclease domain
MIAKRIVREKGASDFERLGAYVLNARGGVDPASWSRLGAYVLDEAHQGEKVAWARVTNCQSDDAGWAVKEILATQARNTRSRGDKSYHLVVSFPQGERPTREQLADIEDRLCAALGFAEHQRVSAVHQNTDNWHMHVAISKVHPRTFRGAGPGADVPGIWRAPEHHGQLPCPDYLRAERMEHCEVGFGNGREYDHCEAGCDGERDALRPVAARQPDLSPAQPSALNPRRDHEAEKAGQR